MLRCSLRHTERRHWLLLQNSAHQIRRRKCAHDNPNSIATHDTSRDDRGAPYGIRARVTALPELLRKNSTRSAVRSARALLAAPLHRSVRQTRHKHNRLPSTSHSIAARRASISSPRKARSACLSPFNDSTHRGGHMNVSVVPFTVTVIECSAAIPAAFTV